MIEFFTAKYGTTISISVDIEVKSPDGFEAKFVRVVEGERRDVEVQDGGV